MQLFPIGSYFGADEPFRKLFTTTEVIFNSDRLKHLITKDSVLLFGGGEDIDPKIYGEEPHARTQKAFRHSTRDVREIECFKIGKEVGAKMLGICRGAQLLCALSGGKLVQHVAGHFGTHPVVTKTGEEYMTSSVHHQMMYPFGVKHQMVAWSKAPLSYGEYWMNPEKKLGELPVEPEIVYFPQTKALAIQGHPEFMNSTEPFVQYCQQLVQEYLIK